MSSGNQHSRSANRNWLTNSPPYGYGGRRAETIVLPVRIIMSPTSSRRFFVGRNARSATLRTTDCSPQPRMNWSRRKTIYLTSGSAANREPAAQSNLHLAQPLRDSFRAAVRRRAFTPLGAIALVAAGCGGGTRQDANEPSGNYKVDVVDASFPTKQRLAQQQQMVVEVRNADTKTIPNISVTVDPGFSTRSDRTDLADPNRPVWIIDSDPPGGVTPYTNTWALGELKPGQSAKFVWHVTPVRAGSHDVHFRVAAGLNGKAKAQASSGNAPEGSFTVNVSPKPAQAYVDPATGKVVE